MPTILITGASSGLGLALTQAYASSATNTLITCDRHASPSPLPPATGSHRRHHILSITSEASITAFTSAIKTQPLDLIIHCIGVRGLVPHLSSTVPGSAATADSLNAMDAETMLSTFHVNAVGTFLLLRSLIPNLLLAAKMRAEESEGEASPRLPKVVVLSSRMGSLSANEGVGGGGAYAYRASKAALNAVVRSLSVDVKEVVWVLCHPGRVESGLVMYKEEGAISAEVSAAGLLPLIEGWGRGDSGKFYDRFGKVIPW